MIMGYILNNLCIILPLIKLMKCLCYSIYVYSFSAYQSIYINAFAGLFLFCVSVAVALVYVYIYIYIFIQIVQFNEELQGQATPGWAWLVFDSNCRVLSDESSGDKEISGEADDYEPKASSSINYSMTDTDKQQVMLGCGYQWFLEYVFWTVVWDHRCMP